MWVRVWCVVLLMPDDIVGQYCHSCSCQNYNLLWDLLIYGTCTTIEYMMLDVATARHYVQLFTIVCKNVRLKYMSSRCVPNIWHWRRLKTKWCWGFAEFWCFDILIFWIHLFVVNAVNLQPTQSYLQQKDEMQKLLHNSKVKICLQHVSLQHTVISLT